jgi:hypothetical protein
MSVHKELLEKLEEVLELVKPLPQGYQYKVRELCSCIETVVSMYDDVQKGIIPEVLIKMREENTEVIEPVPVKTEKTKLSLGDINL